MLTDEQRARRQHGIGASDTAIIMGYSSYKTPYQLYLEKTGIVTDEKEQTEQQYWGNALEPLIVKRFAEQNKLQVTFPDTIYHPDYNFIFANLDGWIASENAVIEAKSANYFQRKEWDSATSDGIPICYLIQLAKQVAVTNADKGYCAVLIGGMEYMQFVYERDAALEELIIDADKQFWHCVENKIEPDPINTNDCRLKYRMVSPEKISYSTLNADLALDQLRHIKGRLKKLLEEEDYLKMSLMSHMGDAEYLYGQEDELLVSWKANKKGTRVFNIK